VTQAATSATPQAQTSSPGEAPAPIQVTLPPNASTAIAPELLATIPKPEPTPDAGADPLDSQDPGPGGNPPPAPDATTEAPGDQSPETQGDPELVSFVNALDENPSTISRVPREKQGAVIKAWQDHLLAVSTTAVQNAYRLGAEHAETRSTLQGQIGTLDELMDAGDVAAFREKLKTFPGGEANYYRLKADMTPVEAGSPEHFQSRANELFAELKPYPALAEQFKGKWDYKATEADMLRLAKDIGQEIARAGNPQDPAASQLARRQAAATERKAIPKPDVTPGVSPGGSLTIPALQKMSTDEIVALRKDPERRAEMDRLVSSPS